jgi:phosphoglycerol transferase MdoB-like AlkP superfamily enzyme
MKVNPLFFGLAHSAAILVFLFITQAILIIQNDIYISVEIITSALIFETCFVLIFEIIILNSINLLRLKYSKLFSLIWGILFFFILLGIVVDYEFIRLFGLHPNQHTLIFSIFHPGSAISAALSELNAFSINILIVAFFITIVLSIMGWRSSAHRAKPRFHLTVLISTIFIVFTYSGLSCFFPPDSIYDHTLVNKTLIGPFFSLINTTITNKTCPLVSASNKNIGQAAEPLSEEFNVTLEKSLSTKPYNIVILIMESVNFDSITPNNKDLQTTPFLNQLAREGIVVDKAYTDYSYTSKNLVSILCGVPPSNTKSLIETKPNGIPALCLPKLLKPFGYNSAFFQTATQHFEQRKKLIGNMGFDSFTPAERINTQRWEKVNYFGYEELAMLQPIMTWVDKQQDPFLLSLITLSSHHDYKTASLFPQSEFHSDSKTNNYLNTVKYVDFFTENLFREFKERDLLDDTLFVITSDHGTTLDYKNVSIPHDEIMHVPLIIWNKNLISERKTVSDPRLQTDILPTIVDLLDYELKSGHSYGASLMEPTKKDDVYSVCKNNGCMTLINERHKFVYYYNHPPEIYDAINDPKGLNNIISSIPDNIIKSYTDKLLEWKSRVNSTYELPN